MMNEECGMMTRQTMKILFIIHHSSFIINSTSTLP